MCAVHVAHHHRTLVLPNQSLEAQQLAPNALASVQPICKLAQQLWQFPKRRISPHHAVMAEAATIAAEAPAGSFCFESRFAGCAANGGHAGRFYRFVIVCAIRMLRVSL
jgi:hypothetical protein